MLKGLNNFLWKDAVMRKKYEQKSRRDIPKWCFLHDIKSNDYNLGISLDNIHEIPKT